MDQTKAAHIIFRDALRHALSRELPGLPSQMRMVPAMRRQEIMERPRGNDARKAAVLICFYPGHEGEVELALIRRNEYDGVHSGQISFPGGAWEDGDADLISTALREAEEEVGIRPATVEVLGHISQVYIPPSNFIVSPVVGWLHARPVFIPDSSEVQEVISITLDEILDAGNIQTLNIPHREYQVIDVACYHIRGHIIWGATAMMLSEMADILASLR